MVRAFQGSSYKMAEFAQRGKGGFYRLLRTQMCEKNIFFLLIF